MAHSVILGDVPHVFGLVYAQKLFTLEQDIKPMHYATIHVRADTKTCTPARTSPQTRTSALEGNVFVLPRSVITFIRTAPTDNEVIRRPAVNFTDVLFCHPNCSLSDGQLTPREKRISGLVTGHRYRTKFDSESSSILGLSSFCLHLKTHLFAASFSR